jgi:metal-responsive CopG/Arc/MetJ family transcriptional regulator
MGKDQISIRLNDELLAKVDAFAEAENRTRSNMIEVLIKEALTARSKPPIPG